MKLTSIFHASLWVALHALIANGPSASAELRDPEVGVGEATLVIGRASIVSPDGSSRRITKGMVILAGDRIETLSNGHVHVKFVDDAFISVRPNSLLMIEEYNFENSVPQESSVKFYLEEGVARTISGKAAKSARDRFRLNTPIAAIGVRGTDFVVSAEPQATKALVNEGAIVIAPFSANCLAEGLGPCSGNTLELVRSGFEVASLRADDPLPMIIPAQTVRAPDTLQRQVQLFVADSSQSSEALAPALTEESEETSQQTLSNEVMIEGLTSPEVRSSAEIAAAKVSTTDFIPTDPITVSSSGQVEKFDHTPPKLMTLESLQDRELVWGRYGYSPLTTDRLALSFADASSSRKIAVGSLNYGLFRRDANPRRVASDLGLVGFQLSSAQALFSSETGIAVMTVNGGSLDIDFQNSSFDTMLSLGHNLTGQIEFQARGRIFDGGFLRAIDGDQFLAGAVSYDGAEAGYLFEKQLGNGSISGLTLWDSK